jgi:tRNA(Ser,Leu) C12 N-acetylase TAN1
MTIANVVITTQPDEYRRACQLLQRFGTVEPTDYFNVLLVSVADIDRFIADFCERAAADPRLLQAVSRVMPLQKTFAYDGVEDFEEKARQTALTYADRLESKSFHVRMHRRGLRNELSSQAEEKSLDALLMAELERRGAPGRITFDDPDAILVVETVGTCAGMSLWSRDDLNRLAFLKTD